MADNSELNNRYLPPVPLNNVQKIPIPFSPYKPPAIIPYGNSKQNHESPQIPVPQAGYAQHYIPQREYEGIQSNHEKPANKLALIGLILSISAIIISLLGSLPAIVLGHIALSQMKTKPASNRWQAITALWLGYVGSVFSILIILFIFWVQSQMI